MSPEFIQKWETLLQDVDKNKVPIEFIKKIILKLRGKKQKTINVERLLDQGFDPDDIEDIVSRKLIELDESVVGIEFILNVQTIADFVQPETDKLLNGL
jgi:hypothetical protein